MASQGLVISWSSAGGQSGSQPTLELSWWPVRVTAHPGAQLVASPGHSTPCSSAHLPAARGRDLLGTVRGAEEPASPYSPSWLPGMQLLSFQVSHRFLARDLLLSFNTEGQ